MIERTSWGEYYFLSKYVTVWYSSVIVLEPVHNIQHDMIGGGELATR